MKAMMSGL